MNFLKNRIEKLNNVLVGLASNVLGNAILFATTIYITRNVSQEIYGEFRLAFSFVSILVIALMLGRDSSILYYYQKEKTDKVIWEEFFSGAFLVIIGTVLLYFLSSEVRAVIFNNKISESNYNLSLLMLPLWALYNLLTPVIRVKGKINTNFILSNLLQRLLRFPFLIVFIIAGYRNFFGLALSMIASQLLLLIFLIFYVLKHVEWKRPDGVSFFNRFGYSLSLGINAIMLSVAGKVDVLLLGKLSGNDSVAVYDIVTSLAIVALFPYMALTKSFEPKLHGFFENEATHQRYRDNFNLSLVISGVMIFFIILFAKEILSLFGPDYVSGSIALQVVCVFYLIIISTGAVSECMTMNGHAKLNFMFLMVCAALNILLCYLLIPKYEFVGASIALGVSLLTSKLLAGAFILKRQRLGLLTINLSNTLFYASIVVAALLLSELNIYLKLAAYIAIVIMCVIKDKKLKALFKNNISRFI